MRSNVRSAVLGCVVCICAATVAIAQEWDVDDPDTDDKYSKYSAISGAGNHPNQSGGQAITGKVLVNNIIENTATGETSAYTTWALAVPAPPNGWSKKGTNIAKYRLVYLVDGVEHNKESPPFDLNWSGP